MKRIIYQEAGMLVYLILAGGILLFTIAMRCNSEFRLHQQTDAAIKQLDANNRQAFEEIRVNREQANAIVRRMDWLERRLTFMTATPTAFTRVHERGMP